MRQSCFFLLHGGAPFPAPNAPPLKTKAAGGISGLEDAEEFLRLGASRLGTSRIVKAVKAMEQR